MKVRRLEIRHFRGFESFDWQVDEDLVALIGAGDSGKTTILDAIELTLSSRWSVTLTENDFHQRNDKVPIEILCHVSGLPTALLSDRRFGLDLRGIGPSGEVHDEPAEGDDRVLAVRFTFDSTHEPAWAVVNDRLPPEGKPISSADRRHFGLSRLGDSPDRHLGWSQGSALTLLMGDSSAVSALTADAAREMRAAVKALPLSAFDPVVTTATEAAKRFGVGRVAEDLTAQLNTDLFNIRGPALNLHSGDIPLDRSGLGSRRLVALALQHHSVTAGGIALIDEIETGLEPYRVRHLLRAIRNAVGAEHGQVILTTHASVVAEELPASRLAVVRRSFPPPSTATVTQVPSSLQALARSNSETLFARRVVVCEGRTEVGLLRGLAKLWERRHGSPPGQMGTVFADGGGTETRNRALGFDSIGLDCLVLADSDVEIDPGGLLATAGIPVVRWADGTSVDQRLFLDLPLGGATSLLELVAEGIGVESTVDQVVARIDGIGRGQSSISDLLDLDHDKLRAACGNAAKKNSWFKRIDLGESAGEVVGAHLDHIVGTNLDACLAKIEAWVYADGS